MNGDESLRPSRFVLLNAIAVVLFACFLHGGLNEWGGDNTVFLLLAKALATGQGYVDLHLGEPIPHIHYPPLFPLLLVPLVAAGAPVLAIKVFVAALGLLGLNVMFVLLSRTCGGRLAWLVTLGVLVSPIFFDPAISVMSDGPAFLLTSLALLSSDSALTERNTRIGTAAIAGLWIGLAFLTRTAALILFPAVALSALFVRSEVPLRTRLARGAVALSIALTLSVPWVVHARQPTGRGSGYATELVKRSAASPANTAQGEPSLPGRYLPVARDLWTRVSAFEPPRSFADRHPRISSVLSRFLLGLVALGVLLAALGGARALLLGRRVGDVFAAGSIAAVLLWASGGPRLLLPAVPFLIAWMATGAGMVAAWLARRAGREAALRTGSAAARATALVAIAVGAGVTFGTAQMRDRLAGSPEGWWAALQRSLARVAGEAGPEARVLTRPATVPFYYHGLRAAEPLRRLVGDPEADLATIERTGADYVILTPLLLLETQDRARDVVLAFPGRFREIETDDRQARAYAILPPP